jgi:hypothetical protein
VNILAPLSISKDDNSSPLTHDLSYFQGNCSIYRQDTLSSLEIGGLWHFVSGQVSAYHGLDYVVDCQHWGKKSQERKRKKKKEEEEKEGEEEEEGREK